MTKKDNYLEGKTISFEDFLDCDEFISKHMFDLAPVDKRILNLLIEGRTHKEISKTIGCAKSSINSRLLRMRYRTNSCTTVQLIAKYLLCSKQSVQIRGNNHE